MSPKEIIQLVGVEFFVVLIFFVFCLCYVKFWEKATAYLDKKESSH